jgi:hypothetical protein
VILSTKIYALIGLKIGILKLFVRKTMSTKSHASVSKILKIESKLTVKKWSLKPVKSFLIILICVICVPFF